MGDEEGFGGESDDMDEEGFGEGDDEEMDIGASPSLPKIKHPSIKQKGKKIKFAKFDPINLESLLADADQFSHLMVDNDDGGVTESVSNKDKAGKKQLAWEQDRDNFMNE